MRAPLKKTRFSIRPQGTDKWRDIQVLSYSVDGCGGYRIECMKSEPLRRMVSAVARANKALELRIVTELRERVRTLKVSRYIYRGHRRLPKDLTVFELFALDEAYPKFIQYSFADYEKGNK